MATSTAEYRHSGEGGPQEFGNYVALNFKMFQVKVAIKKPSTYVDGFTERPDCLYIKKASKNYGPIRYEVIFGCTICS